MRNAYKIFVEKPGGKRSLGRLRYCMEDSKINLRKIGFGVWFNFTKANTGPLVNSETNLRVP
jgi:hypothetical protein